MKFRRFIISKLVSGHIKPTPAVQRVLQELDCSAVEGAVPIKFINAKAVAPEPMEQCEARRLIIIRVRPARWWRCVGALAACALWLLLGNQTFAAGDQKIFDEANQSFAQGRYAEAAHGFESILDRDGCSAPVLYNLANAQFRAGKVGAAILNYERALSLAPNDSDIAANLKLARTKAGVETGEPSRFSCFTHTFSLGGWATLATVALLILCISAPLARRLNKVKTSCGMFGVLAVVTGLSSLGALAGRWPELNRAVVIGQKCVARISPITMADSVFNLPEGETVAVRETHGQFVRIQAHDGRTGWVKLSEIGKVLASARH